MHIILTNPEPDHGNYRPKAGQVIYKVNSPPPPKLYLHDHAHCGKVKKIIAEYQFKDYCILVFGESSSIRRDFCPREHMVDTPVVISVYIETPEGKGTSG